MLIDCPDCKRPVSDQAQVCLGCGLPRPGVTRQKKTDAEISTTGDGLLSGDQPPANSLATEIGRAHV